MRQKIGHIVNLFFVVGCSVLITLMIINYFDNNKTKEVFEEVTITETNTIKESINKIYDSVVVVETTNLKGSGSGSGFFYKKDDNYGYIITNHHVISDAIKIYVLNSAGEKIDASLVGSDEYSDIAVLRVDKEYVLSLADIGDSGKSNLGDTVFTVGSPLGSKYQGTVTKGIISGKDRQITVSLTNASFVKDVIQIDAAINPGNSGGPLVNINGEVIGVNSLKLVEDEVEGMGFAIPIELVMVTISKIEKGEEIVRPELGIETIDLDNDYIIMRYNMNVTSNVNYGALIININQDSIVSDLKKGDIITYINDEKVEDSAHLKYILYKYDIGDIIKVKYLRDNKEYEISITL